MVIQGAGYVRRAVAGALLTLAAPLTGLAGCSACSEAKPEPAPSAQAAEATSDTRAAHVAWDGGGRRRPLRRRPLPPYLAGEDAGSLLIPAQPHAPQ